MGHDHDHLPSQIRHEKPLWWALGLTTTFLVVEVVGAFWTNSRRCCPTPHTWPPMRWR